MIKIPLDDVLAKIKEKTGWGEEEIGHKIKKKMDQLAGLISKEGAAHIIANEQGIKLFEQASGRLKIGNTLAGMRNVEVAGRVIDIFEVREFQKEGRSGKVGSFIVGDETATIRAVLWGSQTDNIGKLEKNMVVKICSGYIKDNQGRKEIHLGEKGKIELNPADEVVGEVKRRTFARKSIKELAENENDIELIGTIVQSYDIRFFEVCPTCNKRAKQLGEQFMCEEHGQIVPNFSYVFNAFLDDGTGNIRVVFFRNQLQNLLKKTNEELVEYKHFPDKFNEIKHELLGKIIKVRGRVSKNELFGRIEFVTQFVEPDPNPEEELAKLYGKGVEEEAVWPKTIKADAQPDKQPAGSSEPSTQESAEMPAEERIESIEETEVVDDLYG